MKTLKKYYKSECGKLITTNKLGEYVIRNTIGKDDKRISIEEFRSLIITQINLQKYSTLMNIYFKDIKEKWFYEHNEYMSLDNFESDKFSLSKNYTIGKGGIPYHDINKPGKDREYFKNIILVYHWGRVYYHTISYGGYPQGQLIDPETHEFVQWCKLKHCSPVFNKTLKKIM